MNANPNAQPSPTLEAAPALRPAWRNWAGNQRTTARRVARPGALEELVAVVRETRSEGLPLKPVGSGHSFTSIAATDGVRLVLDAYASRVEVDQERRRARVQGGMTLRALNALLAEHGLAMSNLGDVDAQTISGAISTGTHGTGTRYGGLATFVEELELVTGTGEVVRCSETVEPDIFAAARVGLGALGVISEVTLRCEDAFRLHCDERPMPLATVLTELDELAASNEHFEFWWIPDTERTLTKRLNRLDPEEAAQPLSRAREWWEDAVLENAGLGAACRLGRRAPRLIPSINRGITRLLSPRVFSDRSDRVFCSPRRVHFVELEYAVPRAHARRAFAAIQDVLTRLGVRTTMPVEVRFAAADDVWLSHSYGRDSAYFAVHQYVGMEHEPYFRAVEEALSDLGGRPHWGKLHYSEAATLAERYPRFSDFLAVRDRLDPDRLFANEYLTRVLGT
ncbi:MAG: FAD-binding protein [Micromonosporaceae bacterium]|nr:FAD-binding protein [Micromonosporaceae bacterium]